MYYVLQSLGIFAASFARLLPVISAINGGIISIRASRSRISLYYNELKTLNDSINPQINSGQDKKNIQFDVIKFENVFYSYPNGNSKVFEDFNVQIQKNQIIGVVGPSGAGKSTFVDLLCGFITPIKGQITADGRNIINNLSGWRSNFAYIPQTILLLNDTIANNIALGIPFEEINKDRIHSVLKKSEIYEYVMSLPKKEESIVGENGIWLSGGQRQRIALARALYQEKDILILDEATSALDPETEEKILKAISRIGNKTILIISHNHMLLKYCSSIVKINNNIEPLKKMRSFKRYEDRSRSHEL